jgi:hypothetical protein
MKHLLLILALVPFTILGQSPGGVSNSNATLQLWLKSDVGITTVGNRVSIWDDQSGNNRHHTQATNARRPIYLDSDANVLYNFNPTINFERANTHWMGTPSYSTSLNTALYIFVVSRLNTGTGYGGDTWHSTYSFNGDCMHAHWFGLNTRFRVSCAEREGVNLEETFALNSYILPKGVLAADPTPRVIWNGTPNNVAKTNYAILNNTYTVGCDRNNTDYMNGDIAEVIVYTGSSTNTDIAAADLNRIQSYLAIKYGITLDPSAQPNYVSSSGSNLWTGATNLGYQNHIFGIGRDNASALHQKVAKSVNDNNNLILSTGNDFTTSNTNAGRPDVTNMNFLMVGDNGLPANYASYNYTGSLYTGTVNSIMARVWKAQETGETGTVYLKSGHINSKYLVVSNDPTFDDSDTWILLDAAQSASANIANGQYFTFAGLGQAPGGELAGLQLWLKADRGSSTTSNNAPLTYWNDNSPKENHHRQTNTSYQPRYVVNNIHFNYHPSINFDGTDAMIGDAFASGQEAVHVFAMSKVDDNNWRSIYGFGRDATHVQWYNGGSATKPSVWTGVNEYPATLPSSNYGVTSHILPKNSTQRVIHLNGVPGNIGGTNNYSYNTNKMSVGSDISNDGLSLSENMLGNIAEVIVYKTGTPTTAGGPMSAAAIGKIQSYLAIKYGVTLSTHYKNSEDITIFSNAAPYNNRIIGIGRDDISGLLQKQSRNFPDSIRIYVSSLAGTNDANTGIFSSDKQYLIIGDDNRPSRVTAAANSEMPGAVLARIERKWKVTNTNFQENFSIDIKFSDTSSLWLTNLNTFGLLVDDDGDFSDANMFGTPSGLTYSYTHPVLTISGISPAMIPLNATSFVTVGRMDETLPSTLISFEATPVEHRYIQLDWTTVSEINNDHFSVERSNDAISWESIGTVDGAGNSSVILNYEYKDTEPLNGISYYRLKQTDYDGSVMYSSIRSVTLGDEVLSVFPNPVNHMLTIEGTNVSRQRVWIVSTLGVDVTSSVSTTQVDESKTTLDFSKLASGVYFVKVGTNSRMIYKQ